MNPKVCVAGSGPAAVAAASALVEQDVDVTMIDVGVELEPRNAALRARLYETGPEHWAPEDIAALKTGHRPAADGLPEKRTYGSDYPLRDAGQAAGIDRDGVDILLSGARGGLSNIWGSNFMPYARHDITDWCVSSDDLAPHYRAVSALVASSAGRDDLEAWFPLHGETGERLRASGQAERLMAAIARHRDRLRRSGILAGYSRLAVQVAPTAANPRGCVYCGLCLYGCPYRLIYSSQTTVDDLQRRPNFQYLPGLIVERVSETGDQVRIMGRSVADRTPRVLTADRVLLACGAIGTTRILLESMGLVGQTATLKDSLYFVLPLLQFQGTSAVMSEPLHTLSLVFLEVHDVALSKRTIQLQVYTYNDLFEAAIRSALGGLFPFARPLVPPLLGRLSLIMGYLHSDDSPGLSLTLRRDGGQSTLVVRPVPSERSTPIVRAVVRKLMRHWRALGALPLRPWLRITDPGKGYHYGGTFPMSPEPGAFETDRLGRPRGFQRVHAVDATVLPSIAATTIVFTAMANAHRIGSAVASLDRSSAR